MGKIVLIGASAGGVVAISTILRQLSAGFPHPIVIVQHISPDAGNSLLTHFQTLCALPVTEAQDLEPICPSHVYLAPANYHLQIEPGNSFSLCVGPKVSYSRPSIDVLLRTAAKIYHKDALAIILTGANHDGTVGAQAIKQAGGTVIVQDPATAEAKYMPSSVIQSGFYDKILTLDKIISVLLKQDVS